ncbi:hypothetical protein T08_2131 [Trichinella sp. T8]|nr:hypothetical protein T08_2131 [Trichinella sp. T8]
MLDQLFHFMGKLTVEKSLNLQNANAYFDENRAVYSNLVIFETISRNEIVEVEQCTYVLLVVILFVARGQS